MQGSGVAHPADGGEVQWQLRVRMRGEPATRCFSPSTGTADKILSATAAVLADTGGAATDEAAALWHASETSVVYHTTGDATDNNVLIAHMTADAEL